MPVNTISQSGCIVYDGKIYCVGLNKDSSYFSHILQNGSLGLWNRTTSYPVNISDGEQCFNQSNLFCCVGGITNKGLTNNTYCSYLENSGISAWTKSTNYPIAIAKQRMSIYEGYVYSVGGENSTAGNTTDFCYYAKINSDGIGSWIKTTSYPDSLRSLGLTTYKGYVCGIGGIHCAGEGLAGSWICSTLDEVFCAPISSIGIGTWIASSNAYPLPILHQGCVQLNRKYYCAGGIQANINIPHSEVYYADLNIEAKTISNSFNYNVSSLET